MGIARLAPTPSGALHLGNVLAFGAAWLDARARGDTLLLRIEDVDTTRARPDLETGIRVDLAWLGLDHDREVTPQSARRHEDALHTLRPSTFRCTCTRAEARGPDGVYPGTCRHAGHQEGAVRWRVPQGVVRFEDRVFGPRAIDPAVVFGDTVLRRRDGVVTYPLAVVADDLEDGVTSVVRGADLLEHTALQIRLHEALGGTPPTWLHVPIVVDATGRKLGKSHGSAGVAALRTAGATPQDIWRTVLPWLGIEGVDHLHDAVDRWRPEGVPAAASLPAPDHLTS